MPARASAVAPLDQALSRASKSSSLSASARSRAMRLVGHGAKMPQFGPERYPQRYPDAEEAGVRQTAVGLHKTLYSNAPR